MSKFFDSINKKKNKISKEFLNLWVSCNYNGVLKAATGVGKTKIALDCINYVYNKAKESNNLDKLKILVVVPKTPIKNSWYKEISFWKMDYLLDYIEIECDKTVCKYSNKKYSLGVFDEIHNYLKGEEVLKIFKNNIFFRKLGLSASINYKLYNNLYKIAKIPIIKTIDLEYAIKNKLINDFDYYNLPVKLSKKEEKRYKTLTNKIEQNKHEKGFVDWKNINLRKQLVFSSENKLKILKELCEIFEEKCLIFCLTVSSCNKVKDLLGESCLVHHSKLKLKESKEIIEKFNSGHYKYLVSPMTLEEGVNIKNARFSIILDGNSQKKQTIQRTGRVLRISQKNKEKSLIIRLFCENTIEESWVKSSQFKTIDAILKTPKDFINGKIRNDYRYK